ncbi:TadE/TadG family type IV pilus assembly protein [Bradyrhizobium sp. 1]|uniref:TadE/TadG family type IV pilus assembly protein n=1 Tax=Bradyrhizobium sp. 1 TaxID=241591 RepID=UPI001FF731E7|nr:TadE/TadG family type IV pilus assembly protein [Bradyrhizobium sp. 1]MCK1391213.1 pilus assembly protein [Bradyrhizobium sp. 1]
MFRLPVVSRIGRQLARFAGAEQGNIAVIFAIVLVPVLGFIGAAVDYSRAVHARSSLQTALDSAALMVSKDLTNGTITETDIETKTKSYFTGLYTGRTGTVSTGDIHATYTPKNASGISNIVVTGSGIMQTDFMQIAGYPTLPFNATSTAAWGNTRMRVAMILDNTGSMAQNGKMTAMQSAAKDMIDTLSGYNKQTGDVYISIVPFSKDVNVDTANVGASWINWTEWEAEPPFLVNNKSNSFNSAVAGSSCPFTNNSHGFTCMDRPATLSGANSVNNIPSSGTYSGYICPSIDSGNKLAGKSGIYYNGCYTTVTGSSASCGSNTSCTCTGTGSSKICHLWRGDGTAATAAAAPGHSTWTGCVNDRDQNYDTLNTAPGSGSSAPSTQFYAEQWSGCLPATVFPMSNQWQTLKDQITAMSPSGNTNQAVGLAWGWQSLSTTNGPIAAPAKASNYIYKDYVVLLSDGLNTQNRWSTSQSSIDARQEILCANVKGDTTNPVTIFTIQVNINNRDAKSQVLQDCATNGNFQMITKSSDTSDAFKNILTQISKLRVAK